MLTLTDRTWSEGLDQTLRLPFLWATGQPGSSFSSGSPCQQARCGWEAGARPPYVTTGLYGSSCGVQWKALIPDFRFFCETVILFHPWAIQQLTWTSSHPALLPGLLYFSFTAPPQGRRISVCSISEILIQLQQHTGLSWGLLVRRYYLSPLTSGPS